MTAAPKVSVVVASYNGRRYVGETIASILGQTFPDFELLIVDDGSTDGTRELLREIAATDPRIRLIEKTNEGLVATLNLGIAEARGAYVARIDHDDLMVPHRIERQVAFLDANPDFIACGTNLRRIDGAGELQREPNMRQHTLVHRPDLMPPQLRWMPGPTPMVRIEPLRRIGGYRPQFLAAEDRDLCWRLGALGPCARFAEVLILYRWHDGNMSKSQRRTQLFSHALGDMSAIARHYCLDDSAIVAGIVPGGDYTPAVTAYRRLLAPHYPIETYWLNFLVRYGAWPLDGYKTKRAVLWDVLRHVAAKPHGQGRLALAQRAVKYLRRPPEVAPE
jgi:glycosyltransferase involved in cell wall biosynthesis